MCVGERVSSARRRSGCRDCVMAPDLPNYLGSKNLRKASFLSTCLLYRAQSSSEASGELDRNPEVWISGTNYSNNSDDGSQEPSRGTTSRKREETETGEEDLEGTKSYTPNFHTAVAHEIPLKVCKCKKVQCTVSMDGEVSPSISKQHETLRHFEMRSRNFL
eukprot:1196303-Prorocentrum_minimum.AAC.6